MLKPVLMYVYVCIRTLKVNLSNIVSDFKLLCDYLLPVAMC